MVILQKLIYFNFHLFMKQNYNTVTIMEKGAVVVVIVWVVGFTTTYAFSTYQH